MLHSPKMPSNPVTLARIRSITRFLFHSLPRCSSNPPYRVDCPDVICLSVYDRPYDDTPHQRGPPGFFHTFIYYGWSTVCRVQ